MACAFLSGEFEVTLLFSRYPTPDCHETRLHRTWKTWIQNPQLVMGRFHVFSSGWWRCCAMYDTTRCSGAEGIHLHLLPLALFSNHVPCGLFPFMCFEWWCLWNWTCARYHFNQWMRLEKHHQFIHTLNSSVHISYTGFKSNCGSWLHVLLLRNVQ